VFAKFVAFVESSCKIAYVIMFCFNLLGS